MNRLSNVAVLGACLLAVAPGTTLHAAPRISLKLVAEGLTSPLALAQHPDGRLLVVDQVGYVRAIDAKGRLVPDPVFDATSRLVEIKHGDFDERGLLDLALHPKFSENGRVYLAYSAPLRPGGPVGYDCTLTIAEFQVMKSEPLRIDPHSERVLIAIDKPFFNHNGGRIAFGPDGYLYIGVGDGGGANDQDKRPSTGNGQNLDTLLGKILRIDVNAADGRGIPTDNPFADGKAARPEIFAYGIRNPWGIGFDRGGDHALFAADVGQTMFEEVNIITRGGNYGWSLREGFGAFDARNPKNPPTQVSRTGVNGEPLIDPIAVYKNSNGWVKDAEAYGTSVTGGYVYRGKTIPELAGHYVYGDWSRNWGLPQGQLLVAKRPANNEGSWKVEPIELVSPDKLGGYIVGFGQDNAGEVYVLTNSSNSLRPGTGKVWKLVPPQ